jgi:hypothetical protein
MAILVLESAIGLIQQVHGLAGLLGEVGELRLVEGQVEVSPPDLAGVLEADVRVEHTTRWSG